MKTCLSTAPPAFYAAHEHLVRQINTMTVMDSGWGSVIPRPTSSLPFLGNDAIEKLVRDFSFESVLDIGCGAGHAANFFKQNGKKVMTLDAGHYHKFEPDFIGNYEEIKFEAPFDCIWASHVLEHIRNPGLFLDKIYSDLSDGGVLAITVPPLKHDIVSGHLNLFNPGILSYHLIQAGFDCRKAAVKVYGYNISIIVEKIPHGLPPGTWSFKHLARYFPFRMRQGQDGRVLAANW